MTTRSDQNRLILRGVLTLVAAIVAIWVLYELRGVLLLIYISTLLAMGFSQIVRSVERWRKFPLPRWAAILVVYVGVLLIVAALLSLVVPPLVSQVTQLVRDLPGIIDDFQRTLVSKGLAEPRWTWSDLVKNFESPGLATSILGALQTMIGLAGTFLTVITVLLLPYYLLLEASTLQKGFLHLFDPDSRPRVARISREVTTKAGAWLSGQLVLGIVIGTTATVGLWILGVPYFYVLGLIAGLGEMVPVIGPILGAVPAILMGLTVSAKTGVFVAIYFTIQQLVENNVLVPRIMERQVGVSAATVIVALLVGSQLLGVIGAVLAVPTAAIIKVLLQEYLEREDA